MDPDKSDDILILGIAITDRKTDGTIRFERFCKSYGLKYEIIGIGQGYGDEINQDHYKIRLLCDYLTKISNQLLVICDTLNTYPVATKAEIMDKFNRLYKPASVIFSSEIYCYPDQSLQDRYPQINNKYRFLHANALIGYRNDIYDLITNVNMNDTFNIQLYFTLKYLEDCKEKYSDKSDNKTNKIILDSECNIFQTLNGCTDDIVLHKNRIYNHYNNSYPIFIHGNDSKKILINSLTNYIEIVPQRNLSLVKKYNSEYPAVFIAVYIDSQNNSMLDIFLASLKAINYPIKTFCFYDCVSDSTTKTKIENMGYKYYSNIKNYIFTDMLDYEYYFLLEQRCIINDTNIIQNLLMYCDDDHRVVSPMLHSIENNIYTNFWGDLDDNNYYSRSKDYIDLVERVIRGIWNVPYISGAILIHKSIIPYLMNIDSGPHPDDIDMQLCHSLRINNIFMYVVNEKHYGFILY